MYGIVKFFRIYGTGIFVLLYILYILFFEKIFNNFYTIFLILEILACLLTF